MLFSLLLFPISSTVCVGLSFLFVSLLRGFSSSSLSVLHSGACVLLVAHSVYSGLLYAETWVWIQHKVGHHVTLSFFFCCSPGDHIFHIIRFPPDLCFLFFFSSHMMPTSNHNGEMQACKIINNKILNLQNIWDITSKCLSLHEEMLLFFFTQHGNRLGWKSFFQDRTLSLFFFCLSWDCDITGGFLWRWDWRDMKILSSGSSSVKGRAQALPSCHCFALKQSP